MDVIDRLEREVRMLRRGLLGCGIALVAFGGLHLVPQSDPEELTIGAVQITGTGITIDGGDQRVRLTTSSVQVSANDRGGVLLLPAELVLNDEAAMIRLQTFTDAGTGHATIDARVRTGGGAEFNAGASGRVAVMSVRGEHDHVFITE